MTNIVNKKRPFDGDVIVLSDSPEKFTRNRKISKKDRPGTSGISDQRSTRTQLPDVEVSLRKVLDIFADADPAWVRHVLKDKTCDQVIEKLVFGQGMLGSGFKPSKRSKFNAEGDEDAEPVNFNTEAAGPAPKPNRNTSAVLTPLDIVTEVFADVDNNWIVAQLQSQSHTVLIDRIVNGELKPIKKISKQVESFESSLTETDKDDNESFTEIRGNVYDSSVDEIFTNAEFYNDVDKVMNKIKNCFNPEYRAQQLIPHKQTVSILEYLKNDFAFLNSKSIVDVFKSFDSYYVPTFIILTEVEKQILAKNDWTTMRCAKLKYTCDPISLFDLEFNVTVELLNPSKRYTFPNVIVMLARSMKRELELVRLYPQCLAAYNAILERNTSYVKCAEGAMECPICYDSVQIFDCVQCCGGHLVCCVCLENMVEQAASGNGSAEVKCLTNEDNCQFIYSDAVLSSKLSRKLYMRYAKRVRQEQLAIAYDEDGLEQCPGCGTQVEINVPSEVDRVLNCVVCKRQTCRICNEPWDEVHFGKKCIELEKDDETKKRKKYEEMMTKAAVRVCHKCKQDIIKEEGCNRITCRCGATFCYLCRAENIDYEHFCSHLIEVKGAACSKCNNCRLFEDPLETDRAKIVEIQKKATYDFQKSGIDKKAVGVDQKMSDLRKK